MRRLFPLVLLLIAAPLAAQDGVPWRASYFPYLIGNPSTGLLLVGHYHLARPAAYEAKVPFDGIFSAEAGWSTNNSRFVSAKFRAPLLVKGWRFAADGGAGRESTFGYYGVGPDGFNQALPPPGNPLGDEFFRVRRTRYVVRGEATRRITGPLSAAVGAGFTHFVFASAKNGSAFESDYLNAPLVGNDLTGRFTLILDTRNDEYIPANGLLLEGGLYGGTGKFESRFIPPGAPTGGAVSFTSGGYAGGYLHLRGYVSPRSGTVVAARFAARALGAGAPLDARYVIPGWERDLSVLGGADSHRSFVPGRFAGRGVLLASFEVRHNLLDLGDLGALTLIGFVDGGRATGTQGIDWTLKGWKVGGGGGVAIRILRSAPLILNFAGGPDGFVFTMGNGWAF